jgi:hypothetical protein
VCQRPKDVQQVVHQAVQVLPHQAALALDCPGAQTLKGRRAYKPVLLGCAHEAIGKRGGLLLPGQTHGTTDLGSVMLRAVRRKACSCSVRNEWGDRSLEA